jgi:hypothetical protein
VSADRDVTPIAGVLAKDVYLQGADWMAGDIARTQATLVRGVVAVFEKTIRLETSSLWTKK